MSLLLRTAKDAKVSSTMQRTAIISEPLKSTIQQDKGTSASPATVSPGSTTSISITINPRDVEEEIEHYLVYDVENKDATQNCTFLRGALTHWENIVFTVMDSSEKVEITSLDQVKEIFSEWFLTKGLNIYEDTSFMRNEIDTFAGITVTNSAQVKCYYPLSPLLNFAKVTLKGTITKIKIDLRATAEPSNAKDACIICKSSAATACYTKAKIAFNDLRYVRQFNVIADPRMQIGALASDVPIRFVHWKTESKTLYSGAWTSGVSSTTFKLSDIAKRSNVQHVSFVVRDNCTAYNDANAQEEYSGFFWIGYKYRELFGENKEVEMTDARLLRDFEMKQYSNEFGRKQLPVAVWKTNTDPLTKYYTRMTRLNFDNIVVENAHEVIRKTDSEKADYDITLYSNGTVSSDCDVVAIMVYAEVFEYSKDGKISKLTNDKF